MAFLKFCEEALKAFVALLMFILVVIVFTNVVLRYGFHTGFAATEELSRILMLVLLMAGAVLALWQNNHIAMTMLVERLPAGTQKLCGLLVGGVMLWCDWLLAQGSWMQATLNFSSNYPLTGLPSATVYVTAAIAGVLLFVITAVRIGLMLTGRITPDAFFGAGNADLAE